MHTNINPTTPNNAGFPPAPPEAHQRAVLKCADVVKIGSNRGTPRLWLEGSRPTRAGFGPGARYEATVHHDKSLLVLELVEDGMRMVSRKTRGDKVIPVIDLNSDVLLGAFEGLESVRVIVEAGRIFILPVATDSRVKERLARLRTKLDAGEPLAVGSLCHGGGISSLAVEQGMEAVGVGVRLAFANDIRQELLEQAEAMNPAWDEKTVSVAMPLQELAFDEFVMGRLGKLDGIEAGLSCSGASVAGRAKLGLSVPEAHRDVGHLLIGFLSVCLKTQPIFIQLENVKQYANSASMAIIRSQLSDAGYDVHETVINSAEWNTLEHRERLCMVAVTRGIAFDWNNLERPAPNPPRLADVLDHVPDDSPAWSEMRGLKDKEIRDKAAGKGFAMQICHPEDAKVPVVTKGYSKRRSTDPKLASTNHPHLLRQFTVAEHARIKGVPLELVAGLCDTTAHEVLGQGICFAPFVSVGRLIGQSLKAFSGAAYRGMPATRAAA